MQVINDHSLRGVPAIEPLTRRRRPFIIAEIGGNHEGQMSYACRLLDDAVAAGADAVKFQTYAPDRIVSRVEAPERHRHFGRFALKPGEYVELARLCHASGVSFMSSLWDMESFRLLDPWINLHKVGSGDLTNYRLLKPLAETGKPLCLATAMADLDEVRGAVDFIRSVNPDLVASGNLCLMHCVAMYGDSRDEFANLQSIRVLQDEFAPEIAIGYSDHTMGGVACMVAVGMGAVVIETHFTDDNSREFRDHHFAHTRESLAELVDFCRRREVMMGDHTKQPVAGVETPERIREFRRAVYFRSDVRAGDVATEDNLTTLRPCHGISATDYFRVLGRRLRRDKPAFVALSWDDFDS